MTNHVVIDYTNYRGERNERTIQPLEMKFMSTEWHAEPQWLLFAIDVKRGTRRGFAMKDIHSWHPADVQVLDLDAEMWDAIKTAARESKWMPPQYMMNDWVSDVCGWLRDGPPKQHGDEATDSELWNRVRSEARALAGTNNDIGNMLAAVFDFSFAVQGERIPLERDTLERWYFAMNEGGTAERNAMRAEIKRTLDAKPPVADPAPTCPHDEFKLSKDIA